MWILGHELICQAEADNGKTRDISLWIIFVKRFICTRARPVNGGKAHVIYY
jgi:hypothetical protein